MDGANRGGSIANEEVTILASGRGGGTRGRGAFEELDTAADAIIQFPRLGTES